MRTRSGRGGNSVTLALSLPVYVSTCDLGQGAVVTSRAKRAVGDLAEWLDDQGIGHVGGAPNHPQTPSKIERWQQTLKNRIQLENCYLPGDLEAQVGEFVSRCNHGRRHESLGHLTPADVYSGRGQTILMKREAIKQRTFEQRRLQHARRAA